MARPKPPAPSAAPAPSPAAHRQVIILRPGPPPRKRGWKDLVVGLVGLVLLIASGVLAVQLPKEDILPPQYKVSFLDNEGRFLSNSTYLNVSSSHDFLFDIPVDNVVLVRLNVYFSDDLAASDPDRFRIELYDPDGNPASGGALGLKNAPPVRNATDPSVYDPIPKTMTYTFPLKQKPEDTVVEADINSTVESVVAEQGRLNHFSTQGAWRLHVTLVEALGCPTPSPNSPSQEDILRSAACAKANSAPEKDPRSVRTDPGNPFTVGSFSYVHFTVSAERLD